MKKTPCFALTFIVVMLSGSAASRAPAEVPRPSADRSAPVLGSPSITVEGDLSLADESNVFKDGSSFLWDNGGNGNTGLGRLALSSSTTGASSRSTGVGWSALRYGLSGNDNTAVGYFALPLNNGDENTAVGSMTLYYNVNGASNTAIGNRALFLNNGNPDAPYYDAINNTAVGNRALYNNNTGSCNTGVGNFALFENSTGDSNTAVGCSAMVDHAGERNTAIGTDTLIAGTTGPSHDNVAVGYRALTSLTTGYRNTALGTDGLDSLLSGSFNISVGAGSGTQLQTGTNNIFIGNQGAAYDSNTIRIGTTTTHVYVAGVQSSISGQLSTLYVDTSTHRIGTSSSSRRFKGDIRDMGEATAKLHELRPVTFNFNQAPAGQPRQFGLIAEEVADIYPELVTYDDEGRPLAVLYRQLTPMLLNDLQQQRRLLESQAQILAEQQRELDRINARLAMSRD